MQHSAKSRFLLPVGMTKASVGIVQITETGRTESRSQPRLRGRSGINNLPTVNWLLITDRWLLTSLMGTRRKSREMALQMLFQADMGKQSADQVRRTFWAEHGAASHHVRGFADDLFRVAMDRAGDIDGLIEKHAEHWRMERMAVVDRNLLRAAVAELLGYPETPRAVVINEALEIARKFSSPESVQFLNGVLDSVGKELEKTA